MSGQLLDVRLDELDDGPNVRAKADTGLRRSIEEHGVLQPITVCRRRGRFEVLYGHRRTAAARAAGLESIPAILIAPPDDLPIRQLVENMHRRAVDPIDIAKAMRAHLRANPGMNRSQLARTLGRSLPYVSNKLELLDLDKKTRKRISAGVLGERQAIDARRAVAPMAHGRPRVLQDSEDGRSRSVVVPFGQEGRAKATVGVDLETNRVDLVVEDGAGHSVMVTVSADVARLLGRRLQQASVAVAVAS